jgi:hypothetical protein
VELELQILQVNKISFNLQWILGNYNLSINKLLGCHPKNVFADPAVGQYCAILSTKNSFRNCVGEATPAKLSKLSIEMAARALNRCGLPVSLTCAS